MDRHRSEKRRRAPRSTMRSVWVPAFAAILVIYVVFVVHVNYYATTTATTANGVGAAAAAPQGREMKEKQEKQQAPEPALAQAATRPAVPLRPEMKRPSRQPELRVGAITKAPAPTTAPPTQPPVPTIATQPPPPTTTSAPITTAPPVTTETVPSTQLEAAVPAPVDAVETAKPVDAPVDKGTVAATAKPVDAPIVKDLTEAPATIAAVSIVPTSQAPTTAVATVKDPLKDRHETLRGYRQTMNYLSTYKASPGESLFLYFTCSDEDFNAHDWSAECSDASKKVYDVFAKSPSSNRLVTIYAGSERFWNYQNKFRNDRDLRIKTVPAILKWHGNGGETSGMMITDTLTEEPLLRYLFKNVDLPDMFLNAAAMVETKTIETVSSYEAYQAKLTEYKLEPKPRRPLYLMFVSGRIAENNRPWCPYCRFSEMPLEYGFKAFAPPNARLLRVEVAQTYQQWKTPNQFNHDQSLGPLRGVPGFFTVQQLASKELKFDRIYERFDRIATLRNLFQTAARVHDE